MYSISDKCSVKFLVENSWVTKLISLNEMSEIDAVVTFVSDETIIHMNITGDQHGG